MKQKEIFKQKTFIHIENVRAGNLIESLVLSYPVFTTTFIEQQQKTLIEKILNNRILIHMRHEQLMAKASQLLYYPSNKYNDPSFENKFLSNNDSTFPTMNFVHD